MLPAVIVFLLLLAAAMLLIWAAMADSRQVASETRIAERMGIEEDDAETPVEFLARDADSWFDRYFYQLLLDAGSEMSPAAALAIIGGAGLVVGATAMVFTEQPIIGFLAGLCGMAVPVIFWIVLRSFRIAAMRRLMPDALDQMADALYGGLTLDQAAEMVSLQTPKPLKQEFTYCVSLLEMGQAPGCCYGSHGPARAGAGISHFCHRRAGSSHDRRQFGYVDNPASNFRARSFGVGSAPGRPDRHRALFRNWHGTLRDRRFFGSQLGSAAVY